MTSPAPTETAASAIPRLGAIGRFGLIAGPLLTMLDSSIVNVAAPDIATDFSTADSPVTLDDVQWIVSGYLLALGVSLALTAFLAKRFGVMRVFVASMILFLAASAACAFAPDLTVLIASRAVQGFVGAPLVPLAVSLLLGKGSGISGGNLPVSAALVFFLAPALGPTLGGLLIGAGGWRWIFLINIPVGIAGLLMLLAVPKGMGAPPQRDARFDPLGFILLGVGLTAALFGATEGTSEGWDSPLAWAPLAGGIVLLGIYTWWALRIPHPVVNLRMARSPGAGPALGIQVLASVVTFGTVFLVPVYAQSVQGHTAFETGIALLPQGIIMGVGTWVGQKLSNRVPLRWLVVIGVAVLIASSVFLAFIEQDTPLWVTAIILSGRAIAIGFVTTPLLAAMLAPLPEDQLADGNTLFSIVQRLGGSVGVSILGSIAAGGATLVEVTDRFHLVGWIMVALAGVALVLAFFLRGGLQNGTLGGASVAEAAGEIDG